MDRTDTKAKSRPGSLGHQLLQVLKAAFEPGTSRQAAKARGDAARRIFGKETMKTYTTQAFALAAFIKEQYPECRRPEDLSPEMCAAFIDSLISRGLAGGTLGRHIAGIRKLDAVLRQLGRRAADAPPFLPTKEQGGAWSFRADTSTQAYSPAEALALLEMMRSHGSRKYRDVAGQVVTLMMVTGLRIQEAAYLRADGIDLERRQIVLVKNTSRTKGGRPRVTEPFDPAFQDFLAELKAQGERNPADYGCVFHDRASLPGHVRAEIRRACRGLGLRSLGSHGFRKLNAQTLYGALREQGLDDEAARLQVARHLGHNRTRVTVQSYVAAQGQRA